MLTGRECGLSALRRVVLFAVGMMLVLGITSVANARQEDLRTPKSKEVYVYVTPEKAVKVSRGFDKAGRVSLYGWYPYYIQKNFNYSANSYTVYFHVGKGSWAHEVSQFGGYTYQFEGYYCGTDGGCNITMTYSGFGTILYHRAYGYSSLYYR